MRKRNFIVIQLNKDYVLKEVDTSIAKAMNIFGVVKGEYNTREQSYHFFYFCPVNPHKAQEIAALLSRKFLEGEAQQDEGSNREDMIH